MFLSSHSRSIGRSKSLTVSSSDLPELVAAIAAAGVAVGDLGFGVACTIAAAAMAAGEGCGAAASATIGAAGACGLAGAVAVGRCR